MNADSLALQAPAIPGLRQELRIEAGAPLVNGAPSWTIIDPVRHAFFQIGRIEFRIFSRWAGGSFDGLSEELAREGLAGAEADNAVTRVIDFSLANSLTVAPMGDSVATFARMRESQRKAWWRWMVDNYLFFRIPLVKPASFLERTIDRVAPIGSPAALIFFTILAVAGLILVSRQWDAFLASFLYFFSWQGLAAYALGLSVVKVIHELGHAYTATRFGCRVPSMGVSFLVMFPVLYTDTTGAWRLRSRKQRLAIDCAGVGAELVVASLSTMAWVLLPEGAIRSAVFVLATSSWLMSLAINLNPFMRFDGYYVLSDLLDVPNLQPRAFALGRWRLRELLFAFGEEPPEQVPSRLRQFMIGYAWCTWAYRFVLFIGIALLVYFMFFKLLGLLLFAVEIGVFVVRPVANEMRGWWERRAAIGNSSRRRKLGWLILAGIILGFLPLDRNVSAPAVLSPIDAIPLVPGDAARVEKVFVRNGEHVKEGAPIAALSAPDIDQGMAARQARISKLEEQLSRTVSDSRDLADRTVLEGELATEREAVSGLGRLKDRLILRAPRAGLVTDIEDGIHPGRWLAGEEVVARIITPNRMDVQAYVDEDSIWRIASGATARFVSDDPLAPSRQARIVERGTAALQFLDQPILASVNGGPIAVNVDEAKRLKPRTALYRVRFVTPVEAAAGTLVRPVTGALVISAQPESLFGLWARQFARIFRREASAS